MADIQPRYIRHRHIKPRPQQVPDCLALAAAAAAATTTALSAERYVDSFKFGPPIFCSAIQERQEKPC